MDVLEGLRPVEGVRTSRSDFNGDLERGESKTHQFEYRPSTVPSASSNRAETTIVRGTSLSFVRTGCPSNCPCHSSVAAFGASSTAFSKPSVQSESRSNALTASVARLGASVAFVAHTSRRVSIAKNAAEAGSAYVLCSLRVMPTV